MGADLLNGIHCRSEWVFPAQHPHSFAFSMIAFPYESNLCPYFYHIAIRRAKYHGSFHLPDLLQPQKIASILIKYVKETSFPIHQLLSHTSSIQIRTNTHIEHSIILLFHAHYLLIVRFFMVLMGVFY